MENPFSTVVETPRSRTLCLSRPVRQRAIEATLSPPLGLTRSSPVAPRLLRIAQDGPKGDGMFTITPKKLLALAVLSIIPAMGVVSAWVRTAF